MSSKKDLRGSVGIRTVSSKKDLRDLSRNSNVCVSAKRDLMVKSDFGL